MKVSFTLFNRSYYAETKRDALDFINYWRGPMTRIHRIVTTWKIKGVEKSPGYIFQKVELDKIGF